VTAENGDKISVYTFKSKDGFERIIGSETRYCSIHGPSAAIGTEWSYAIEESDEDAEEYGSSLIQIWVDDLQNKGDLFSESEYAEATMQNQW